MAPTPRPGHHTENSSDGAEDKLEFQDLKVMELHDEDAKGWKYRGEGAANIVLAYHGNRPSFVSSISSLSSTYLNLRTLRVEGTDLTASAQ